VNKLVGIVSCILILVLCVRVIVCGIALYKLNSGYKLKRGSILNYMAMLFLNKDLS
jgi:hypothetical protein